MTYASSPKSMNKPHIDLIEFPITTDTNRMQLLKQNEATTKQLRSVVAGLLLVTEFICLVHRLLINKIYSNMKKVAARNLVWRCRKMKISLI